MSVCTQNVPPVWESTQTELTKTTKALNAIQCIIYCVPAPRSPDCKPNDLEYQALRAQASSTLEAFPQFLSTPAAIELVSKVDNVFYALREHGEEAGLLSPPLIRAMSGYLDAYKIAHGELPRYLDWWIRRLYRNLKPDKSEQVRSLPFLSYQSALTSNFTLIQNNTSAVMVSASADAADSDNPPLNSSFAPADTSTNCASDTIPSVQGASSARPEGSFPDASRLTSFPTPSTDRIHDSASVELTPSTPMSEDAPIPQGDPGPAQIDLGENPETPARAG